MYHITAAGGTDENGVAIKAGDNVVKTSTGWDNFGGTIDLSAYVTSASIADERTKLAGIEAGAQVNIIESVKVDGTALTVTDKAVNIVLSGKVSLATAAACTIEVPSCDDVSLRIYCSNGDIVCHADNFIAVGLTVAPVVEGNKTLILVGCQLNS